MGITKHDTPNIFADDIFNKVRPQIQYWQNDLDNYVCHIFLLQVEKEANFAELWETMTAKIAVLFQSELARNIEIWNIYLVILVKEKVSREIKYKIEQNKFCCRKLVEDGLKAMNFTDDQVTAILEQKIFKLKIAPKPISDHLLISTTAGLVKTADPEIAILLSSFKSNQQFDKYYQRYKKLQNDKNKY